MIRPLINNETISDYWAFPKGHPDEGEDHISAAIRETFEETRVQLQPNMIHPDIYRTVGYSFINQMHNDKWKKHPNYPDEAKRPVLCYHKQVTYYFAEVNDETADLGPTHETAEVEWVPIENVLQRLTHNEEKTVAIYFHGVQDGRTMSHTTTTTTTAAATENAHNEESKEHDVMTVQPLSVDTTVPLSSSSSITNDCTNNYLSKYQGIPNNPRSPSIPLHRILWSFFGSFLGIFVLASFHYLLLHNLDYVTLVGSFGAHAVLIFAAPHRYIL
jgi:8-oxo-dGTP pyrophosphatase MutT (NUDIX family)